MKIDNKGWGLNTLILMICIILVFLFIATYFAIRINSMLGNPNNESEEKVQNMVNQSYYINKVNDMRDATEQYIYDNDIKLSNYPMRISMTTLVAHNYMSNIYDSITGNICLGYSTAYYDNNNIKIIRSYIKCDNYESKGYGES